MAGKNKSLKKTFFVRCYAELNDFLPPEKRQKTFSTQFKTPVTVQEILISWKIPLSEVDLILVNGQSVSFSHFLQEMDRISIYPTFESLDISNQTKVRNHGLRESRFILDAHLGKLAKYLRMLGFDTLYRNDFEDDDIIEIAQKENRIILTRDRLLLKSSKINHGYFVRAIDKHEQLREIVQKYDLYSQFKSFSRCMTCNYPLTRIEKSKILPKVKPEIARVFDEFFYCKNCDKVFWKGSHFKRMEKYIRDLI
ncbi:Mut7-C RNAse domain-containing protein [Echinicola jeungdonensis]|uniref:Mut7-C RNAse domain-containing protein n=1 Tax=Echinicola jeungdonensis TaxID=709343 RepID=A0ABV5J3W0_9BACT|nr:Mut7-C RNAse domain-containing protein [Echinicola jeungdonensis]MDN3670557.1 Mut7-C RNAse domain-containing protein [Echinicola jeungdonensis]